MKNISSFLILVIIFLFFTANNFIFSQESQADKSYSLSFGASFGSVFGNSSELVYPVDTKGEYLSELIWEMNSVFYFDINIDFGRKNPMSALGFFASASFKLGIPGYSGIHQNRDWMSIENSNLTHFSSHKNMLRDFYRADASIGLSIPVKSWFYIRPVINGSWMHFAFSGTDGKGKYSRYEGCTPDCPPPWESTTHPAECGFTSDSLYSSIGYYPFIYQYEGEVIRYKQDWLLAGIGFTAGAKIFDPFLFELSFFISPFTYCAAVDEHIGRKITFNDFTAWGLYLEPGGSVSYVTERLIYSLEFSYCYIGKTAGNSYSNSGNGFSKSINDAGAGLSLLNVSFSFKVRI